MPLEEPSTEAGAGQRLGNGREMKERLGWESRVLSVTESERKGTKSTWFLWGEKGGPPVLLI